MNSHEKIIEILNRDKDKIDRFEFDAEFFVIWFKNGDRVEVEAERDCGVFATLYDN